MGLRTTNRTTPSLTTTTTTTKEIHHSASDLQFTSTSRRLALVAEPLKVFLHPDAAILDSMAPALTEPLSPTNKLSSSAASASPRPTAAGSPLQNNNTNNNNNQSINNNNDSAESIDGNSSIEESNSIPNSSGSKKEEKQQSLGVIVGITAPVSTAAKGAFQLAFEQSVAVRNSSNTSTVNGDALSANSSQMGPMCDAKSSQPPPSAANSVPLIKSKISQIDSETAAEIITTAFENFPSDLEEAIAAEFHLKHKLKSNEERKVPEKGDEEQEKLTEVKAGESSSTEKPMDEPPEGELDCTEETLTPQAHEAAAQSADEAEEYVEKDSKADEGGEKAKVNIISVQELPPIRTDSTVTASEDDNIEERLKQLDSTDDCALPITTESCIPATPPRTPSVQMISQLTPTSSANLPTASVSSLTPQSTTSTVGGSSLNQKDFKDNTSEMDHDIEDDLLQVLKNFDTTTGGDICDFAGFLNDYAMNYEDVNPPNVKENPLKEVQVEIDKNQQTMQRRIDFLLRRMRKLQARYMSKQASEEISGLFEWSARTTKRKNSDSDHQQLTFAEEKYHPVSTNTMRNVLKKIESVAVNVQHVSPVKKQQHLYSNKDLLSSQQAEVVVPTYDDKVTEEIAHVSGLLQAEMREVQSAIDSDATASSSGGESADEMVTYNNQLQEPLAISKRAAWRYSRDRAAIASRWSWLLSQISDLEFKIRQHAELHQQLRQLKGKVVMLNASEASSLSAATGSSSVNGYRGALPGGTAKGSGYTTTEEVDMEAAIDAAQESSQGACRTRAFQSNYFRKRKLFQTANVHTISKKAARPSTIKCGCQSPLHPCALCTGRPDPTAPRDLPDTMMMSQRVALLDPSFHPVLSFSEDISNSIYFEATSRDPDWQNRVVRSHAKAVMKGALAAQRAAEREEQRGVYATSGQATPSTPLSANASNVTSTGKRKYTKRNHQQDIHGGGSHSTTPLVANKLGKGSKKHHRHRSLDNNHYHRKNNNSHHQTTTAHQSYHQNVEQSNLHQAHSSSIYQHSKNNKIRKLSSASAAAATLNQSGNHHHNNLNPNHHHLNSQHHSYNNELNFLHCDSLDGATSTNGLMGPAGRSRASSPSHGSGTHYKYERSLERKSRSSYDIDNIVIPYSVAASTRVEILPYKEIPTPKWRIVDYEAEDTKGTRQNSTNPGEKNSESTEDDSQMESNCQSNAETSTADDLEASKKNDCDAVTSLNRHYDSGGDVEEEDEGEEDISDEAMILRHERALTEERRKFQTFLKFPWSTRSRANRRADSRAESSGANTPDPTSPAPNTPSVGGDQESIPSPFAPSTPLNPLDSIAENSETTSNPTAVAAPPSVPSILNSLSKKQERRRTVSSKRDKDDQRRSSTPDPRELIPPYEPLVFPIPNDLYDSMLRMMPDEYPPPQEDCRKPNVRTASAVSAAITNGVSDTNNTTTTIVVPPLPPPKNVCDSKVINNNKNAFLTLNNQKGSGNIEHVTGEDQEEESTGSGGGPVNGGETLIGNSVQQQVVVMGAPAPPTSNHQPVVVPITQNISELERSSFVCRNNLLGCSDTESVDSETGDDDPNDPEWKEEEPE